MNPIRITPVVKALVIACIATFVVQQSIDRFFGGNLIAWLGLVPSAFALEFKFWQVITYSFLHNDVTHLVLNLLMLVFVGSELEALWGKVRFLRFYTICVVGAGISYLVLQLIFWRGANVPMVGASGGIYGLLVAYGLLFGERTLLFMMLFPMKAKHFVWILAGVEFFTSVFSGHDGLSSTAHLGGMATGFLALWLRARYQIASREKQKAREAGKPNPSRRAERRRKAAGPHLKLVIDNKPGIRGSDDDDDAPPKSWH